MSTSMRRLTVGVAAAAALVAAAPVPAVATDGGAVVASGLSGPRHIAFGPGGVIYVTEADAGRVSAVDPATGTVTPVLTGLNSPQGVSVLGDGQIMVALGHPPEGTTVTPSSALVRGTASGGVTQVADLLQWELANNPDGQQQFDANGEPLGDALSNPYGALALPDRTLVADAGANDVIEVRADGTTRTFFAPRNITDGQCAGAPNNDPDHPGCDPVPTDVQLGPDGYIYVSGLGSETFGAARVWKLDPVTGAVVKVWDNLTTANGLAVGPDGTLYVSELIWGFTGSFSQDPSTVGRIVRIAPDGTRTYAPAVLPGGLAFRNGTLYAATWTVGNFFGQPDTGRIETIPLNSFGPGYDG